MRRNSVCKRGQTAGALHLPLPGVRNCGSRLWHELESPSQTITIKAGSLEEPVDVSTATHIWVSRKLPGMILPAGAKQFPGEPE